MDLHVFPILNLKPFLEKLVSHIFHENLNYGI